GTRCVFLVPRAWTDAVLPLHISNVSALTRVMVGRIELVTPEQRAFLHDVTTGTNTVSYDRIGRFRNALILDEQKRRPTAVLANFIEANKLGAFTPVTAR